MRFVRSPWLPLILSSILRAVSAFAQDHDSAAKAVEAAVMRAFGSIELSYMSFELSRPVPTAAAMLELSEARAKELRPLHPLTLAKMTAWLPTHAEISVVLAPLPRPFPATDLMTRLSPAPAQKEAGETLIDDRPATATVFPPTTTVQVTWWGYGRFAFAVSAERKCVAVRVRQQARPEGKATPPDADPGQGLRGQSMPP
jgi:hypothetical protein